MIQKQEIEGKINQELKFEFIRKESEEKAYQRRMMSEMKKKAMIQKSRLQVEEAKKKEELRSMMQNMQCEMAEERLKIKLKQEQAKKDMIDRL